MRSLSYDDLYIAGRWQAPATTRRLSVISPHTEEPIGEVPEAAPEDVDRAIAAAREAFDDGPWPRLSPFERIEKIEKLAAINAGHLDEMADLITAEMGSPRSFSRLAQAAGAASMMAVTAATARESRIDFQGLPAQNSLGCTGMPPRTNALISPALTSDITPAPLHLAEPALCDETTKRRSTPRHW